MKKYNNQRTNVRVNAHLMSGPTVSTNTNKIGKSQPRVITYINFVELESPVLHAKFQDYRTSGSGEEDFKGFYHIHMYGHGGHIGHVTYTIYINFLSHFPRRIHMKFVIDWPIGFREEVVCK